MQRLCNVSFGKGLPDSLSVLFFTLFGKVGIDVEGGCDAAMADKLSGSVYVDTGLPAHGYIVMSEGMRRDILYAAEVDDDRIPYRLEARIAEGFIVGTAQDIHVRHAAVFVEDRQQWRRRWDCTGACFSLGCSGCVIGMGVKRAADVDGLLMPVNVAPA